MKREQITQNRTSVIPINLVKQRTFDQLAKIQELKEDNFNLEVHITTNRSNRIFGQITLYQDHQVKWRTWKPIDNTQIFYLHNHIIIVWNNLKLRHCEIKLKNPGLKTFCQNNMERIIRTHSQKQFSQSTVRISTGKQEITFFNKEWRINQRKEDQANRNRGQEYKTTIIENSVKPQQDSKEQHKGQRNQTGITTEKTETPESQQETKGTTGKSTENTNMKDPELPLQQMEEAPPNNDPKKEDAKDTEKEKEKTTKKKEQPPNGTPNIQATQEIQTTDNKMSPRTQDPNSNNQNTQPTSISTQQDIEQQPQFKKSPSKRAKRKMKKKEQETVTPTPQQTAEKERTETNEISEREKLKIQLNKRGIYGLTDKLVREMNEATVQTAMSVAKINCKEFNQTNLEKVVILLQYSKLMEEARMDIPLSIKSQIKRFEEEIGRNEEFSDKYEKVRAKLYQYWEGWDYDHPHGWIARYFHSFIRA